MQAVAPMQVNIHEAKTQLSKLIRYALEGEEVVIAKGNHALVRLEALPGAREQPRLGTERGLILRMDEDFGRPVRRIRRLRILISKDSVFAEYPVKVLW